MLRNHQSEHGGFYGGQSPRDPLDRGPGRSCGGLLVTDHPAGRGRSQSSLAISSRLEAASLLSGQVRGKAVALRAAQRSPTAATNEVCSARFRSSSAMASATQSRLSNCTSTSGNDAKLASRAVRGCTESVGLIHGAGGESERLGHGTSFVAGASCPPCSGGC